MFMAFHWTSPSTALGLHVFCLDQTCFPIAMKHVCTVHWSFAEIALKTTGASDSCLIVFVLGWYNEHKYWSFLLQTCNCAAVVLRLCDGNFFVVLLCWNEHKSSFPE
jgi:hypothetical protein